MTLALGEAIKCWGIFPEGSGLTHKPGMAGLTLKREIY